MDGVKGTMISGVQIIPLRRIPDERGSIYKIMSKNDDYFIDLGEIYVSTIRPMAIKAWHRHNLMTLNYVTVSGNTKLVLYDDRIDSFTNGVTMEIFLGEDNFCLVKIPPKIWNGFKCVGNEKAFILNCASIPHDPDEQIRLPYNTDKIPYDWGIKHE